MRQVVDNDVPSGRDRCCIVGMSASSPYIYTIPVNYRLPGSRTAKGRVAQHQGARSTHAQEAEQDHAVE